MGPALLAGAVAIALAVAAPVRGGQATDDCPGEQRPPQIEVLVTDFVDQDDTCRQALDTISSYGSLCPIHGACYSRPDAIYKVRLHEGNAVAFHLEALDPMPPAEPADLVLVLVRRCGIGGSCVVSSPDFIGSGDEEIPTASYDPDDYYLYVDAANDHDPDVPCDPPPDVLCGPYRLRVTGVNPTPDLVVELEAAPEPGVPGCDAGATPETVVAGCDLSYTLHVTNVGVLEATQVRLTQGLPAGVDLRRVGRGCESDPDGTVVCEVGTLARGATVERSVTVRVDPATRSQLESTVQAAAYEGDPTPANNRATVTTPVEGVADLSITKEHSHAPVVAGTPLTYTLRLHNAGPSDATRVVVTDPLPAGVDFASASAGCVAQARTVTCTLPRIVAGADAARSITVDVAPSARASLFNTVSVAATETDHESGNNSASLSTRVIRQTDLSISKTGPEEVVAGEALVYTITVTNAGPSDSTGATVEDTLPAELIPGTLPDGCTADDKEDRKVTCTLGPLARGADTSLSLGGRVDPALRSDDSLCNRAEVTSNEPEPPDAQGPNSDEVATAVRVEADLVAVEKQGQRVPLSSLAAPEIPGMPGVPDEAAVYAGENLLYTVVVANRGPSDSNGGSICDALAPELELVASPDGCWEATAAECPGNGRSVICPVPYLLAPPLAVSPDEGEGAVICGDPDCSPGSQDEARFVVAVDSGAGGKIENSASVEGYDPDGDTGNNTTEAESTQVAQAADLAVALRDSPDPVVVAGELTYILEVVDEGPSNAEDVEVSLQLPEGASFSSASGAECTMQMEDGMVAVVCDLGSLPVGPAPLIEIETIAPASDGAAVLTATACVTSGTLDPADPDPLDLCKDSDRETTHLVPEDQESTQADVAVAKTSAAETAVAGDLLRYTLSVVNNGPAAAAGVRVEDPLPAGVSFVTADEGCEEEMGDDQVLVTCELGDLEKGEEVRRQVTVRVDAGLGGATLSNTACAFAEDAYPACRGEDPPGGGPPGGSDPNLENNVSPVDTPVLEVAPLVLPSFQVEADPNGVTTLLAVRNRTELPVAARFDYFLGGSTEPVLSDPRELKAKGTYTENLRDHPELVPGPGVHRGHVEITPLGAMGGAILDPRRALSGDFLEVDSAQGLAAGEALLATDASRVPPELCRRWDVRFLSGGPLDASTDFVFFLPDNPGAGGPVALGRVYSEAGRLVQVVSVTGDGESFTRGSGDLFDDGLPLLAGFGTIEWELQGGLVGNVSAVLKAEGKHAVAVPGVCRLPAASRDLGPEAPLVLPYFEVDGADPAGLTTLLAVRNGSDGEVTVQYRYFSSTGLLWHAATEPLPPHATRTVNLRDVEELYEAGPGGVATGWVEVEAMGAAAGRRQQILSGDFTLVDPAKSLGAGGALVSTGPERRPPGLCQSWEVRFFTGGKLGTTTDLLFFLQGEVPPGQVVATGQVYAQDGEALSAIQVTAPDGSRAFKVGVSDLLSQLDSGPEEGSIELGLADGLVGYVATLFRADGSYSVLIPGVCGDETEEETAPDR